MLSTNGSVRAVRGVDRKKLLENLMTIRCEWEEAANGVPLNNVQGSVGMLLADVTIALELTPEEQIEVLGSNKELG